MPKTLARMLRAYADAFADTEEGLTLTAENWNDMRKLMIEASDALRALSSERVDIVQVLPLAPQPETVTTTTNAAPSGEFTNRKPVANGEGPGAAARCDDKEERAKPVAWMCEDNFGRVMFSCGEKKGADPDNRGPWQWRPLYTSVPSATRQTISPTEESVRKYLTYVESCDRGSFSVESPSKIAIDAQKRCLRQLLDYLGGDEYLALHVEDAVKRSQYVGEKK